MKTNLLPNPVTLSVDTMHEGKAQFIAFLAQIEVLSDRPWAAQWIEAYWTDELISEYVQTAWNGVEDYTVLEHMSEWLDGQTAREREVLKRDALLIKLVNATDKMNVIELEMLVKQVTQ